MIRPVVTRGRCRLVLLTTLVAAAPPLAGQVAVDPGGVATVVARVPAPAGADSVRFRLQLAPGVRTFGRADGAVAVEGGAELRLPFTFGVPASARAGHTVLGRLHLEWPAGRLDSLDLAVVVAARRLATFRVGAESLTATAGKVTEFGYRLRNRGNAADTFRITIDGPAGWEARVTPALLVVAPGDTAVGTARLLPPERAASGQEAVVRITMTGSGVRESLPIRTLIISEGGWLGNLAHVPGTLFVGSSSDTDGVPGVALEAGGEVRPGTRVSLAVRHTDDADIAPAFRGRLGGPRLRLEVASRDWNARLGDIFTPAEILTGPVSQGRGAEVRVRRGDLAGELFAAAPLTYGLVEESGLVLRGSGSLATPVGRFGLKAASVRKESALFGPQARGGATATWAYRDAFHDLSIEAGVLAISGDSAHVTGLAAQGTWLMRFDRGSVAARLRKVPATTRASPSQGNEAFASGTVRVTPAASLIGWGHAASSPYPDGRPYGASSGGAAGLRLGLPLDVEGELLGTYRQNDVVGDTLPPTLTRAIRASLDVPLRRVMLESDVEVGTASSDAIRAYRQVRAGARWAGQRQWAWVGLSHYDFGIGPPQNSVDLAGALMLRRIEVQGGLNARLPGAAPGAVALWSAGTIPVGRELAVSIGVDHRPAGSTSPWRFSLGVSRGFGMPQPLSRHPVLRGVVFEDLNGNLLRDAGEPRIEGAALLLGPLRTRSGAGGAFRFHDAARGELRLDPSTLSRRFVVPAEVVLPTSGYVEIPLIRTAAVEFELFFDRDGDGEMDEAETFADAAVVSLRDAAGRTRDAATDSRGRVRFGSLAPGDYTLLIHAPDVARRPLPPLEIPVAIAPGSTLTRRVAVPLRRREIRMPGAGR